MPFLTQTEALPEEYQGLGARELEERTAAAKKALGSRLVILGHHYQRDEVIKFADFRGDSLKLSQQAAQTDAEFIVFAGVHFMAETADILTRPHQKVILPDLGAGCSMADMADIDQVEECWEQLADATDEKIVPITYINSAASLKAFCGRNDGAVCTSSNAGKILAWAWQHGQKALFFPDEHLGRNTAVKMGVPLDRMVVWDPREDTGGLARQAVKDARIILWKGYCSVHQHFTVQQISNARREYPGCRVIVHPECAYEVVQAADDSGSTEYIIKAVTKAAPGTTWVVGTEIHLVNRLSKELPDRTVLFLDDCVCMCSTMYRIDPEHLLWVLENLVRGRVVNQITVDEETRKWALIALDRMLKNA
jgi:quinolinate synthase